MKNKPEYHQSDLTHYFDCPLRFQLSTEFDAEIGQNTQKLMREGNIFEHYVFDDNKHRMELDELQGRMKQPTIDAIQGMAEVVQPIFMEEVDNPDYKPKSKLKEGELSHPKTMQVFAGEPYVKLKYETEEYDLAGEADWIGAVSYTDETGNTIQFDKCIGDLKKTGDINRVWGWKVNKEDYLQACMYTYIVWKNTGELLPFVYFICEDSHKDNPIILALHVEITEEDLTGWFEPFIQMVHEDQYPKANFSRAKCLGEGTKNGRCWYLKHCKAGRALIAGGIRKVHIADLETRAYDN